MSRLVSRRFALKLGAALAVTGALGAFTHYRRQPDYIAGIVREGLPYLSISDAELQAFARNYKGYLVAINRKVYLWARAEPFTSGDRDTFETRVLRDFLLSTDFFRNGAVESQPVVYIGYIARPRPCGNPFATFDL